MKNKIIIVVSVLAVVGMNFISCNKFLTIQPQFEFTSTVATTSLDGISKTAIGAFNAIQSTNLYGGGIIANSELLADFVYADPISDYSTNQLRTRQMDPSNGLSGGMWNDGYKAIYIANVVLQYAPNFASQSASQVQLIRGESFFIRGIIHFELLRAFAQPSGYTPDDSHLGIPIVLTPGTITTGQNTPRSTVAQCYAQIEKDLDSAAALLPNNNYAIASQVAAKGFLVRMYFTQHKYQQALTVANDVINNYGLSLDASITEIDSVSGSTPPNQNYPYGGFTNETIFQQISYAGASGAAGASVATVQDINNGAVVGNFYAYYLHGATYACSAAFHDGYFEQDSVNGGLRAKELYHVVKLNFQGTIKRLYTSKYDDAYRNVTVMRLSEILLDRAECNARLGAADAVVRADYNLINQRAGGVADNSTSGQQALLNAIWQTRDYELAYEGDRFFEIKEKADIICIARKQPIVRMEFAPVSLSYPITGSIAESEYGAEPWILKGFILGPPLLSPFGGGVPL